MSPEPWKDRALPRSLHPLALLAARETGAAGFAIYQCDQASGRREAKLVWGAPIPEAVETGLTVTSFPLRGGDDVTGVLAFVFREASIAPQARTRLDQVAAAIEEVWRLSLVPAAYARNAARIGELETELADSKIADRARGLLARGPLALGSLDKDALPTDAIGTIVRHVESVLRPGQLGTVIEQLSQEIEREIEERELANRAK
ncbi:MAG TPA: hypothetical protein VKG79_03340, partial [Bryobacteraceae bacterium]|nr:hypothetical protein [Bryobacteraceae bacterium]